MVNLFKISTIVLVDLVNNYIIEVIDSKYDSREEHQYIRSHDNYCKKERIRKMR